MMLFRIVLLLMFSFPAFAINTWQQAMDQCLAPLPPGGGGNYCKTYYATNICGATLASLAQGYIRREWDGFTAFCSTSNTYVFGDDGCSPDKDREALSGVCVCPSGQVEDGSGGCMVQPADCTSAEITQLCESNICTGTYQPPVSCWLSSSAAPSGCEAGTKTSPGCPAVCLGDSTEDPITHACIDPTCVGGQTLVNHSCVDPTCIGGQTYDSANHSCIDPTCGDGYTLNSTTKQCDFSGCGSGFVQGKIDGSTVCVKSGTTTTGTQTVDVSGTTNQTSTTTTNPDGSQTTTTSGTSTTSGTQSISLDTGGLAQESTVREGVEAQKDLLNLMKGEGASISDGSLGDLYDGTVTLSYSDSLTAFKNRVSASALGSSASGLFTVTLSGSCPSWVIPATALTPALTIDQICSPAMTDIWPFIAAILLATATFFAYRIAFL